MEYNKQRKKERKEEKRKKKKEKEWKKERQLDVVWISVRYNRI